MADTYEKDLAAKSTLTTSDYIRVVGSDNVSYKQLVSDVAQKVIESYTGSTLAGSAQSVQSAINALNGKKMLRYTVTIPSITIGANGYTSVSSYYPGAQTGYMFLFAVVYNFGTVSTKDSFMITGNSDYLLGTAGATITNCQIAYIYAPSVEARS